ncbi:MAG: hypothetical protein UX13_C0016G0011 [Candidatus Woesebacteria bacterium GW2011_GWB1_45_5]|uniref:TrbL/VirB6 plasmid conjugal transfer protein n=1 Tax=Candidatus Woesebacteria bacterium GW2011_GWB1_45_5 TaxID=1618581 RepID=A0A0G1MQ01_9BACT|nr:MAG: hypothetical protein UX13_C0016G0011 [Candidatus Woesebacteria bacterium GW2011_GWB1_45_5]
MSNLLKKLTLSFLCSLILFFSFAPVSSVRAEGEPTWYDQSFNEWFNKVYDDTNPSEIFGERYTAAQVQWILYGLGSFLITDKPLYRCISTQNDLTCVIDALNDGLITENVQTNQKSSGLVEIILNENRPLSFVSYARSSIEKFKLVPEVQAQSPGFGFSALDPIREIWVAARDAMYGLFVLFAIILAFMIMFRVKISPQVVISVQSSIPKIIVGLILVTFSYAIAGFLVDLMYVIIGLLSLIVANSGEFFASDPTTVYKFMTTGYVGLNSTLGVPLGIFGVLAMYTALFSIVLFAALMAQNGGLVAAISAIFTLGIIPLLVQLISMIAFVVLFIVLIIIIFKIIWMLLKAFAQILLLTIFAPIQIALGVVIPSMGIGSWIKSFVSNLAVFPVTGLFLVLSFLFMKMAMSATFEAFTTIRWWDILAILPGGAGIGDVAQAANGWPPLLGGPRGILALIYLGVSFVIITLIPKTVEIIQGLITGRPFAYGTAIGEAVVPALGLGKSAVGFHVAQNIEADRNYERENPGQTARARPLDRFLEQTILARK